MEKVFENNGYTFYEYTPSIFKPFYIEMEPTTLYRRFRFLLAYFTGYKVYYMKKNDDYVGYCIVQNGKDKRYKFASDKDIIVGPYFINENHRGKKLSTEMLEVILHKIGLRYNNAFDYIRKTNIASIKASCNVGFSYFSDASISRITRQLTLLTEGEGDYCVMKYKNSGL